MRCETCGFDRARWTDGDLRSTLRAAAGLADHVAFGAGPEVRAALAPVAGLPGDSVDADAVHRLLHLLHGAGRLRHAGTPTLEGTVAQLSRSGGGVPKTPVDRVRIDRGGLEGDVQGNRKHHGRPWQAVCLWSAEVVEGLQADGHPIGFGSAGENVTVRGLDWALVTPGALLLVGSALLAVSSYAIPCAKNARWFRDGQFRRLSHEAAPGASRVYATVLVEGLAAAGDAVVLEPTRVPRQAAAPSQLPLPL